MLVIRPNIDHLNEIHVWLKDEYMLHQEGFYCNWQKIKEAFDSGELFVLEKDKAAIGFLVFTEINSTVIIDIAEVKPSMRKKGFGREFINQAINHFKYLGAENLKVYCSPSSTEPFWREFGFENSDNSLIELGVSLTLKINTNFNVNPSLISVSFS